MKCSLAISKPYTTEGKLENWDIPRKQAYDSLFPWVIGIVVFLFGSFALLDQQILTVWAFLLKTKQKAQQNLARKVTAKSWTEEQREKSTQNLKMQPFDSRLWGHTSFPPLTNTCLCKRIGEFKTETTTLLPFDSKVFLSSLLAPGCAAHPTNSASEVGLCLPSAGKSRQSAGAAESPGHSASRSHAHGCLYPFSQASVRQD